MSALQAARVGAVLGLVAWSVKSLVIALAGGLDRSPLEGPLFLLGMVATVVGGMALGAAVTAARAVWVRVAAAVLGAVVVAGAGSVLQTVLNAALPDSLGWFRNELGLIASAAVLTVVVFALPGVRGPVRAVGPTA
jgi:hypothetical protein